MLLNMLYIKLVCSDDCVSELTVTFLCCLQKKLENGGGTLLVKLWQGKDTDSVMQAMRKCFAKVQIIKPLASRADSAEIFLLARQLSLLQSAS